MVKYAVLVSLIVVVSAGCGDADSDVPRPASVSATDEGSAPADGSLERQLDIGQDIKAIIWFEEGTSRERMYEVFLELVPPGELFPFAAEFVPEQRAILVGSMSDDVDASSLADLETRATQYVEVAEFEHV